MYWIQIQIYYLPSFGFSDSSVILCKCGVWSFPMATAAVLLSSFPVESEIDDIKIDLEE